MVAHLAAAGGSWILTLNETITRFGYPDTLIREYNHWVVLLRPVQATLGALILACKDNARRYADIPAPAFAEMAQVVDDIETALTDLFGYQKLNYLMLMMVDPNVHYHVLPRYEKEQSFAGVPFADPGWPGPPNIGYENPLDEDTSAELLKVLKNAMGGNS